MKHKPLPSPDRRLLKQGTKRPVAATIRHQHIDKVQQIISNFQPTRIIDNPFTSEQLTKIYGVKFTNFFFSQAKELYLAKDEERLTAYHLPDITKRLNRLLRSQQHQLSQRYLSNNNPDTSSKNKSQPPPQHTLQLCHLYLVLHSLYVSEDAYLHITQRQIFTNSELKLEEIPYVTGLWSRGHGQHIISRMCHIDVSRVRALYRSLEEAHPHAPLTKLDPDKHNISNKLFLWIVANAKIVSLGQLIAGSPDNQAAEAYIIPKQFLDAKAFELETEYVANLHKEEKLVPSLPDFGQSIEEAIMEAMPRSERESLPIIIDPLAADNSYKFVAAPVPALSATPAELQAIAEIEAADFAAGRPRKTIEEYLKTLRA